ncbi:MAG: TIGR02757 family protein [Nitrospinae bacterium]|nr:TIGR02757 family protein [Nitrospinota bacterium]
MNYKRINKLKICLDGLYSEFKASYLSTDPIVFLSHYEEKEDKEIVGFISSCFAYGSVSLINRNLKDIFSKLTENPSIFLREVDIEELIKTEFVDWKYRFHKPAELEQFLLGIQGVLRKKKSLEKLFMKGYRKRSFQRSMETFVQEFVSFIPNPNMKIKTLIPPPSRNSPCKRFNLFLRWMVRKDDIDTGLWTQIPPSDLFFPVDTHIHQITRDLGIIRNKYSDWKSVVEITNYFKKLDPKDPVKYDFSLTRLAMTKKCPLREVDCFTCLLSKYCKRKNIHP